MFDEAIKYVNKVKNAFRDEKHIPSILRTHGEFQIPKKKYRNSQGKIIEIFQDRRDLILGFNFFLPTGHEIYCHFH